MASKEEQVELGRLILQSGMDVLYIKNVQIEENVNEHGSMRVRFLSAKQIEDEDCLRYQGSDIQLVTADGETVFGGKCTSVSLLKENQYTEAEVLVRTASIQTDQDAKSETFQGTGKTLNSIIAAGMGKTALVQLDEDIPISEMLSQENETDWIFTRRIANQYQKQLFVNSKTTGCQIHIGNAPFQKKELGLILHNSVGRDVDKVRNMQGNDSPDASVFEFEENTLMVSDLTLGVGYAVNHQGRTKIITKSRITSVQGMLQNEITLCNEEGIKASVSQSAGVTRRSSILTGTVLAVEGTNVQVDFGSSGDAPRWIPYAHAVSNYFYSMPDEGDTVFVYYETGDSDKIVCLGSKHVNESPDFGNYKDKMLTANNRMVKFGDKSLNLIGDRSEFDGLGEEQAKIIFNDETGIEIQSTQDICLETTDGGNISIQAVKEDFTGMDTLKAAFEQMYGEGQTKYEADGGNTSFDALAYLQDKQWDALKQNVKDNLMAPFQIVGTLQELAGRIGGSDEAEAPAEEAAAPEFTEGVVSIFGMRMLVLKVGNSSITFSNGIIQIKADTYMQLGTDRSVTYEHLEDANYTWRDMLLDVTQLALDIVGALPIPGVSTVANLANAGISLARGDYVGAAMSAGTAALSLLPGANTAAAAGKVAATVATKAPKVMKAVSTIAKVVKAIKSGAETASMILTTGMALWDVGSAMLDGSFDWNDPQCRQDVFSIMQGASTVAQSGIEKNTTTDKDGKKRFMNKDERKTAKQQRRDARRDKVNKAKESTRAKLDEYSANRCKNGEPIDMVTGSYLIEQCDFMINDITGIYAVERTYESLLASELSPIGRGWTLSLFSTAYIYDDRVEVVLPDNHTETFLKTAEGFQNRRGGSRRMTLQSQEDGYLLTEADSGLTRFYDASGKQLQSADKNGNKTVYHYIGNTLQRIHFASGQYLEFQWEQNKVISITDCLKRKVTYQYDGDFLTEAGIVTGGVERYAYDSQGHITDITDANGVTFVHNEYDAKGRVTRQTLSTGQEYILLYAEDDRTNTYLVPANGKEIRYLYNKDHQLIRTEYQDGTTEETAYDSWENRIWEKDRRGAEIHRAYDAYGHLLEERQPDGLIKRYQYDEQGNCVHTRDSVGLESWYTYDSNGNLLKEEERIDSAMKREIRYEYDKYGRIIAFTDANGKRETYRYEKAFWENTLFVTAAGCRYRHGLDSAGRCVTVENADGSVSYAYNNFDIVCMETNALGNTSKYIYDRVLDLTGVVKPNHFDPLSGEEKRECYTYDALHYRLTRVDEEGAVFATLRDGEGNIIKEVNPNAYDSRTKDGAGIEFRYDANDRNTFLYYPDGGVERRWYDAAGNLTKVCLPEQYDTETDSGAGYSYAYDSQNRLEQVTSPEGAVLARYVYDLHGNLIKAIDAKGMQTGTTDEERIGTLYTYNYAGWLLESRKPMTEEADGKVLYQLVQYRYDAVGNRIKEKRFCEYQSKESASGIVHTISYAYDADDRLIRVSDCTGAVLEYQYDELGRRSCEKQKINDTESRILRYRYDKAGRMTELMRTADREGCGRRNVSVKFEYDKNGNNIKTILPSGAEIHRKYDAADRLITERHLDKSGGIDNTTYFNYDKAGNLVCITDNQGRKTGIEYDLLNREIRRTEKDGSVTRQFYDKNGQLTRVIRPNEYGCAGDKGTGMQYTYDAQGNVLTVIGADGILQEQNVYDADGVLIRTMDGTGGGAGFSYDLGGRRTKIETKGSASQQYRYDAMGNIIGIEDGVGNQTGYMLDKWGRIVEIKKADGSNEYYAYDCAGNMTKSTDGEGNTTTYTYNNINQLSVLTDPAGGQERYAYDAEERLCRKTDRNGTETRYAYNLYHNLLERRAGELFEHFEYTPEGLLRSAISGGMRYSYAYDTMNRLAKKMASGRTLLSFAYDKNGNLIKQKDVSGKVTEYRYDLQDRILEVWDDEKQVADYEYHADGTVKALHCGSLYTEYAYDTDRNLTGLKTMLGNEVLAENHYRYDGNGNRLEKMTKQGTTAYTYDSINRLTKVEYPGRKEELFYDKAGNRTRRVSSGMEELYRYNQRNELTTYSRDGKVTGFEYDKAGNLLRDDKAEYAYDAFGRTVKVETFSGEIQINRYDAEGLRHEMEENGKLVSFIFRGTEIVAEETKEDRVRYIRSGELLASDAESARTYYHYASDEMGSITHVTGEESVLNRYEYDAWGNPVVCEETAENRFKFNGQQYDPVSRQYYLRARYYNPVIGRFTQEDTYRGDGLNLYAYCANNPVYYVDPSGHICETVAKDIMKKRAQDRTKEESSQLTAYLRNKERKGGLTDAERSTLNQLNGYKGGSGAGTEATRVGRWMSQAEYDKMVETGKVQMSGDNKVHVANPADIEAFRKQAPIGSIYVEFDVPNNTISAGGTDGWGIINGPGSLKDRLNAKKGLPRITEMPSVTNIEIKGSK